MMYAFLCLLSDVVVYLRLALERVAVDSIQYSELDL